MTLSRVLRSGTLLPRGGGFRLRGNFSVSLRKIGYDLNMNVIVADDHLMIREGVKQILSRMKDYTVIAEASDGQEAFDLSMKMDVDLLIADIGMPNLSGIEVLQRLKAGKPEVRVIILSMFSDEEHVRSAVGGGADGYILKDDDESVFQTVIQNVVSGCRNFSPRVQSVLLRTGRQGRLSPVNLLTSRELEVFRLIARGRSHKEIASLLGIAVRTIDFHKRNIRDKLGVESTYDLIMMAEKYGINQDQDRDRERPQSF